MRRRLTISSTSPRTALFSLPLLSRCVLSSATHLNSAHHLSFYSLHLPSSSQNKPFLQFAAVLDTRFPEMYCYRYLSLGLLEMDVSVDQIFLLHVLDFVTHLSAKLAFLTATNEQEVLFKGPHPHGAFLVLLPAPATSLRSFHLSSCHLTPLI